MVKSAYNLITILGPTAVGKTSLAAKLAHTFNGEIISADSRQVYRKMDIGTGKDLSDYIVDGNKVLYHLIDIIDPSEEYNLFSYLKNFYSSYNKIIQKKKTPFLVGGTGLYLSAVLKNYDLKEIYSDPQYEQYLHTLTTEELAEKLLELKPVQHNITDIANRERTIQAIFTAKAKDQPDFVTEQKINSLVIGVVLERSEIKKRITARLKHRLKTGMIEEVEKLLKEEIGFEKLNFFGLEYRYIGLYLAGKLNYNDMFQKLNSSIHQFAKRQMTWFRKMEKEGIKIHWIEGPDFEQAKEILEKNYFS